jgi:hypothetical protein
MTNCFNKLISTPSLTIPTQAIADVCAIATRMPRSACIVQCRIRVWRSTETLFHADTHHRLPLGHGVDRTLTHFRIQNAIQST